MPKRVVRTAAQRAASRRNLEKARAAKISRARYKGKSELPRVEYTIQKAGAWKMFRATSYNSKGQAIGEAAGQILRGKLTITDVSKLTPTSFGHEVNNYAADKRGYPSMEPGISLLTAAARVAGKKAMEVKMAVPQAHSFYKLTGGKQARKDSWTFSYGPAARKALAGRRIVRVRKK